MEMAASKLAADWNWRNTSITRAQFSGPIVSDVDPNLIREAIEQTLRLAS